MGLFNLLFGNEDEVRQAALEVLSRDGRPLTCSFLSGADYETVWKQSNDWIVARRKDYEALPSSAMRYALLGWLDYEERNNNNGRKEAAAWQRKKALADTFLKERDTLLSAVPSDSPQEKP